MPTVKRYLVYSVKESGWFVIGVGGFGLRSSALVGSSLKYLAARVFQACGHGTCVSLELSGPTYRLVH